MARAKPAPVQVEPPPRRAIRASWRDPDDLSPGRRQPREIAGWRRYCPLRRMSGHPSSGITALHLMAADRLREVVDLATLGYSAQRPLIFSQLRYQPRWGMGPAEMAQLRAMREVRRVVLLFSPAQLLMLDCIVLGNISVRQWAQRSTPPLNEKREKQKLMIILDRLVTYYDAELKDDVLQGRRLAP